MIKSNVIIQLFKDRKSAIRSLKLRIIKLMCLLETHNLQEHSQVENFTAI